MWPGQHKYGLGGGIVSARAQRCIGGAMVTDAAKRGRPHDGERPQNEWPEAPDAERPCECGCVAATRSATHKFIGDPQDDHYNEYSDYTHSHNDCQWAWTDTRWLGTINEVTRCQWGEQARWEKGVPPPRRHRTSTTEKALRRVVETCHDNEQRARLRGELFAKREVIRHEKN